MAVPWSVWDWQSTHPNTQDVPAAIVRLPVLARLSCGVDGVLNTEEAPNTPSEQLDLALNSWASVKSQQLCTRPVSCFSLILDAIDTHPIRKERPHVMP